MNKLTVGGLGGLLGAAKQHPYLPTGLALPGYAPPARSLLSVLVPFFGVAGAVTAWAWAWAGEGKMGRRVNVCAFRRLSHAAIQCVHGWKTAEGKGGSAREPREPWWRPIRLALQSRHHQQPRSPFCTHTRARCPSHPFSTPQHTRIHTHTQAKPGPACRLWNGCTSPGWSSPRRSIWWWKVREWARGASPAPTGARGPLRGGWGSWGGVRSTPHCWCHLVSHARAHPHSLFLSVL
jgi:hypothetical protein